MSNYTDFLRNKIIDMQTRIDFWRLGNSDESAEDLINELHENMTDMLDETD